MTVNEKLWDLFAKWDKINADFLAKVADRRERRALEDLIRREGIEPEGN